MGEVTLILRRPGRGNWSPVTLQFDQARHALPTAITVRRGDPFTLQGITYRVSRVIP